MTDFVLLGPSLPRTEAAAIHNAADYLPPVTMGDLYRLVETRARPGDRIAIIDGLFEQVPAVWHKEVLYALSRGIHVYGASSIGALRAAELHPFGMVGVGRVFEAYRDGMIVDDDEVAVAHATEADGFRALSTAMVSIRFGLEDMVVAGTLPADLAAELLARAKAQLYFQRHWGGVLGAARELSSDPSLIEALRATARAPDGKARDAEALLRQLAETDSDRRAHQPNFVFRNTSFWSGLVADLTIEVAGAGRGTDLPLPPAEIARHYRAAGPERHARLAEALLDRLVRAATAGYAPSADDLRAAQRRVAEAFRRRGIRPDAAWRRREALDDPTLAELIELDARHFWLMSRIAPELDRDLLRRMQAAGELRDYAERLAAALIGIVGEASAKQGWDELGIERDVLERWYAERFGPMLPDPYAHAKALGFDTLRDFVDCLVPAFLAGVEVPAQAADSRGA